MLLFQRIQKPHITNEFNLQLSSLMIWLTVLWAAGGAARIFLPMRVAVLPSLGRAYDMAWA